MKSINGCKTLFTVLLLLTSCGAWAQHTVNNETNNNTSGCSSPTATYVGATSCQANFPGARDDSSAGNDQNNAPFSPVAGQVVDTVTFAAVPKNIADFTDDGVDIHNLVYAGYAGPIFANIELWHDGPGNNGNGFTFTPKQPSPPGINQFNNHYETGYINNDTNQVQAQLNYMQRLKIDGIVANPPGPLPQAMTAQSTKNRNVNAALEKWKSQADATAGFLYSVMTDQVMWEQNNSTVCGNKGLSVTPNCVERVMICSLDYMNTPTSNTFVCAADGITYNGGGYFADSHYWKVNGRPVMSYFLVASSYFGSSVCSASAPCAVYNDNQPGLTCTSSTDCWTKIWGSSTGGIQHHISNATNFPVKPYIIHRNTSGPAAPAPNDGTFRWFNISTDQTYQNLGPDPHTPSVDTLGYDGWLTSAFNSPPAVFLGIGYGKVDHAQSPFEIGDHKIVDARCGQTFLDTMSRPSVKNFGTSHPFQALEIATWDDYDEGSEMETGIDICVNTFSASLNGSALNWSINFNNAQYGSEAKIDHYALYYTTDGSTNTTIDHPLTLLTNAAVNNTGSYSFPLPNTLPNPTILYVKAVAKPMLQNRLTAGVLCSGCAGGTTVTTVRPTVATPDGVAYTNPANAEDGNLGTFSAGVSSPTQQLSGEIWSGFGSVAGTPTQINLKISSAANCATANDGLEINYSVDGGSTWNLVYIMGLFGGSCFTRPQQTDVISLPLTQDLSLVKVLALFSSTGASSHQVFDSWIEVTH
jgi:hypothetical protein